MAIHPNAVSSMKERILMVEDHPLFVRAMQDLLRENYPRLRVEVAQSSEVAASWLLGLTASDQPYAILCDLDLPDASGVQAVQRLRPLSTAPLWVISAASSQAVVDEVLACGADGFISKRLDTDKLLAGLRPLLGEVVKPDSTSPDSPHAWVLSSSQQRVAEQLVLGLSNKEIASVLHLGLETVKTHVSEIMARLQARNRTEAVLRLLRSEQV
jgi:DNA-binding NarL/FixJ family response regulator